MGSITKIVKKCEYNASFTHMTLTIQHFLISLSVYAQHRNEGEMLLRTWPVGERQKSRFVSFIVQGLEFLLTIHKYEELARRFRFPPGWCSGSHLSSPSYLSLINAFLLTSSWSVLIGSRRSAKAGCSILVLQIGQSVKPNDILGPGHLASSARLQQW